MLLYFDFIIAFEMHLQSKIIKILVMISFSNKVAAILTSSS